LEMVFVWKQNYILVDEYFFFCCTWIVNSAEKSVSYNILKQGKHAFILSIGNRAIMHCAR
nr:hypothetical protein [Escherichia coli]